MTVGAASFPPDCAAYLDSAWIIRWLEHRCVLLGEAGRLKVLAARVPPMWIKLSATSRTLPGSMGKVFAANGAIDYMLAMSERVLCPNIGMRMLLTGQTSRVETGVVGNGRMGLHLGKLACQAF